MKFLSTKQDILDEILFTQNEAAETYLDARFQIDNDRPDIAFEIQQYGATLYERIQELLLQLECRS